MMPRGGRPRSCPSQLIQVCCRERRSMGAAWPHGRCRTLRYRWGNPWLPAAGWKQHTEHCCRCCCCLRCSGAARGACEAGGSRGAALRVPALQSRCALRHACRCVRADAQAAGCHCCGGPACMRRGVLPCLPTTRLCTRCALQCLTRRLPTCSTRQRRSTAARAAESSLRTQVAGYFPGGALALCAPADRPAHLPACLPSYRRQLDFC